MRPRFVGGEGREESEAAPVDSDDRNLLAGGFADHAQERAVAADDAAGVEAPEETLRQGETDHRGELNPGLARRGHEFPGQFGRSGFLLIDDKGESADGLHGR